MPFARFSPVCLLILVLISGCSEAEQSASPETVTLTYWPAPNPEEIKLADTLVTLWNKLHPSIQVKMQPIPVSQSTEEVLLAAIAAKTTPDICSNIWPGALHEYTLAGGLVALDRFPDFDSLMTARTPPTLLKIFTENREHAYQIPWKTNPVMMICNVDLFRRAGIRELPRTYTEYLQAGEKIVHDHDGDGDPDVWLGERDIRPLWWQRFFDFYSFYIAASGGKTLFEGRNETIDRNAGASVLNFFRDCYRNEYFPRTFFQGGDPFLLGIKATHFSGPWQIAAIRKFAPDMEYAVLPVPVPDGTPGPVYTYGDFKNIAIFSTTKHPAEAWEFVKFLVAPEHDLLLLELASQIPVRRDLTENPLFRPFFQNNPDMARFAEQAAYTRSIDEVPDLKEIFDALSQEYETCAVYGRKSPEEAVEDMAQRIRLIMEWNE